MIFKISKLLISTLYEKIIQFSSCVKVIEGKKIYYLSSSSGNKNEWLYSLIVLNHLQKKFIPISILEFSASTLWTRNSYGDLEFGWIFLDVDNWGSPFALIYYLSAQLIPFWLINAMSRGCEQLMHQYHFFTNIV